jgi:hypothetical protein
MIRNTKIRDKRNMKKYKEEFNNKNLLMKPNYKKNYSNKNYNKNNRRI